MPLKNLDKKAKQVGELQAKLDCRTRVELEAIKLITEGRHKEAIAILDALDDKVMKDFLKE